MFRSRYSWNIAKVGIKHKSINQSINQSIICASLNLHMTIVIFISIYWFIAFLSTPTFGYNRMLEVVTGVPLVGQRSDHIHYLLLFFMEQSKCSLVNVHILASSVRSRGFESRSGQTKVYNIVMCCFSAQYLALRRKSKDWLARNQDKEWGNIYTRGLFFQWASTIKI
jgi:hypothetical protein